MDHLRVESVSCPTNSKKRNGKMTDSKNGKGFSGFDDLVSDISKDLEEAKAATDSHPTEKQPHSQSSSQKISDAQTSTATQQTYRMISTLDSLLDLFSGTSIVKWAAGIFIALVVIFSLYHGTEKKKDTSYVTRPERATSPAPAPSPTLIPEKSESRSTRSQPKLPPKANTVRTPEIIVPTTVPVPPRVEPKLTEIVPPVGTNNILGRDEIRYCLSEDIRVGAMRGEVDLFSETEVNQFNSTVQDYNSRCGKFRYRQGTLESVRSEVEAQRSHLESEGTARIKYLRGHSSSVPNTEKKTRKPEQASFTQQRGTHSSGTGIRCSASYECGGSNQCLDGQCRPSRVTGERCSASYECGGSNQCLDGQCRPSRVTGGR
jgi:hypothetical protein